MKMESKDEIDIFLANAEIRKTLVSNIGENAIAVLEALKNHSEDEEIAEHLKLKVSDVRSVLNKLNEEGFVYYERVRDNESGWYYYHWKIDLDKFKKWINERFFTKFEKLKILAQKEEYYFCTECGLEILYNFGEAMDIGFKCPNCNTPLDLLEEEKINSYVPKISLILNENGKKENKIKKRKKNKKRIKIST